MLVSIDHGTVSTRLWAHTQRAFRERTRCLMQLLKTETSSWYMNICRRYLGVCLAAEERIPEQEHRNTRLSQCSSIVLHECLLTQARSETRVSATHTSTTPYS